MRIAFQIIVFTLSYVAEIAEINFISSSSNHEEPVKLSSSLLSPEPDEFKSDG